MPVVYFFLLKMYQHQYAKYRALRPNLTSVWSKLVAKF